MPESELKIGQMPTPKFFKPEEVDAPYQLPFGIDAYSTTGEIRRYLYWANIEGDLRDGRDDLAIQVAELIIRHDSDMVIGPAIYRIDPEAEQIHQLPASSLRVGLYVDHEKRYMVGQISEKELDEPLDQTRIVNLAEKVARTMPYPDMTDLPPYW